MRKGKIVFLLVIYFVLPLAAAAAVLLTDPGICVDPLLCVSYFIGVAGYTWLILQLVLSARIRFLERGIGLDRLLVFHRIMAPVSIALLLIHAGVKFFYYPTSLQKLAGLAAYVGFIAAGGAAMVLFGSSVGRNPAARALRSFFFDKLKRQYQDVKVLHNFTFLLSVILFVHVMLSAMGRYYPGLRIYFIGIFIIGVTAYIYHKLIRPTSRSPVYRVGRVSRPAENVTTIEFELEKGRAINHNPGQFAFFRFLDRFPGPEEHPFTISAAENPAVTAKALGDFTGKLPDVKEGARVRIDGPYGVFTYRAIPRELPMVFIAGGIGITPFLSMLRGMRREHDGRTPLLLWSVRRQSEFIYLDELRECSR
ncbi:MAG: ferric reductase-like transmembrane domain-containing protein, partial [Sediminispirochaetaceae bacterium]